MRDGHRHMVNPGKQCLTFTVIWLEHVQGTDDCYRACAVLAIGSFLETVQPWAALPWRGPGLKDSGLIMAHHLPKHMQFDGNNTTRMKG